MRKTTFVVSLLLFNFSAINQVLINEIQVSNMNSFADQDGDFEDWFELYNSGLENVNLLGYGVSDNGNPLKWVLPEIILAPGEHVILWASAKDLGSENLHYETAIFPSDTWKYLVPTSEPNALWRTVAYNDASWNIGPGGFGYGDGDDGTTIGSTISVFARKTFNLTNVPSVTDVVLHFDYDDAFVAYLNGVEIARANIGTVGIPPAYNAFAAGGHEANVYQGIPIDTFIIPSTTWNGLLNEGTNVLAIQTHNVDAGSSDLTGNAYLTFGFNSFSTQFTPAPEWMGYTSNESELHTNFKLDTGEELELATPDGLEIDEVEIPSTSMGDSYARMSSGSPIWCYAAAPTHGTANENTICATGYEPKPIFSLGGGQYPNAIAITMSTTGPGAQIRYTNDGSVPDLTSALYTGPISISNSSVISAKCFSTTGLLPSPIEKNTYMINESDLSLPVISISTDYENLYDEQTGIYVLGPPDYEPWYPYFGANFWEDWERESYMEYFNASGIKQFEGSVGLKIHGGWSRAQAQKSLRIKCRDDYGFDQIQYPLISDKPYLDTFKGFNLRNGGNDYGGPRFHDALMQRVMKGTHVDYMAYTPVLAFLNGDYFGMYELRELEDENYCANNTGIDPDNITVISYNYMGFNVISGSDAPFFDMYNFITQNNPNSVGYFDTVGTMLDIENYVDYIIAETYWCNGDWSNGWINNTKFWHNDNPGGKWRFMLMDLDFGMGLAGNSPNDDYINTAGDEGYYTDQIFAALIQNTTFRNYFINRYADLINTTYQQSRVETMAYEMRDQLLASFDRHCTTWGTDYNSLYWAVDQRLDWNEQRIPGARNVVQNHFGLPNQVNVTLQTYPIGSGYIKISTIVPGTLPWTGVYFNGVPVQVTAVPNPGFTFTHWSVNPFISNSINPTFTTTILNNTTFRANFTGAAIPANVVVSEINYNSDSSRPEGDWIELHNSTMSNINMSNWRFTDSNSYNEFIFPMGTVIPAGGYLVLAENLELFSIEHPGVTNVLGEFDFDLSNAGESVKLSNIVGATIFSFTYDDAATWPCTPDGHGRTLERKYPLADASLPTSWFDGCMGGSPGMAYVQCDENPVVTEINYKSDPLQNAGDWIEFHNKTETPIDLSGWSIGDDNGNSFVFPPGTTLGASAFLVICQDLTLFTAQFPLVTNVIGSFTFGYSGDGDVIRIIDEAGRLFTSTCYNDTAPWPLEADGLGYTLELENLNGNLSDGNNWFAGCLEGSPGTAYDPLCLGACQVFGCNDPLACNYVSSVVCDDGSCTYPGCTNPMACNYNSLAGCDDGTCTVPGCLNLLACNYNPAAGCNDGSCIFAGCTNPLACNYSIAAGCDDGTCSFAGCTNSSACNYDPLAGCEDNSCVFPGCNDPSACNFNPSAGCDDGSCLFPGCTDPIACNYVPNAGCDDGTCISSQLYYQDTDLDGYGNSNLSNSLCELTSGWVLIAGDCNDAASTIYPNAPGTHQGIDNNCNGAIDPDELSLCTGDYNNDGVVNISDLLLFIANYGCGSNCGIFDLTGDDTVNVGDLLIFMSFFGTDCP